MSSVVVSPNYKAWYIMVLYFVYVQNKKSLMALVCESVKYKDVLDNLVKRTKLTEKSHSLTDPWLASVLVYDLLIGRGIHGAAKLKVGIILYSSPGIDVCDAEYTPPLHEQITMIILIVYIVFLNSNNKKVTIFCVF